MALFDNNASGFASRLENIDKSGIIELTREVENLTKATADYEQKAEEAFSNGVALTKRQKDAYRDYETSVKATASAQKALREAIDATNASWRGAKGADKKELAEKIGLYKELQKALTDYKSGAQSALTAGAKVYNDKAVKRNVIQDATGQKNGEEVLPVAQVKAQSESIVESANKAREAIQEVASGSIHTYTRKGEYFSDKSHSGWYGNELKKMSDEELKEERERLQEDSKTRSYGSDEERLEGTRIDSMLKWVDLEIKAREKLAKSRKSSGSSKTSKGVVPKEQTEQEFNSLQELNEAIRQTQGELDALHQRTKDTGIIKEGDIEEAKTLEKELSRLVATRKLLVGKNLVEKQQPQAEKQPNEWRMFSLPDDGIAEAQASSFEKIKNAVSTLPSVFASAKSASTSFIGALGSVGSAVQTATAPIVNITKFGLHLFAEGCKKAGEGIKNLAVGGFNLLKSGAERAIGGIKGIISHFKQLGGNTTKKLTHSLTSLKSMLMRRIKRTFISSIFNQAKEGLQALAKFDSGFNQSMSNIKNASQQAAGNLSGVLGNLITLFEPVILNIINLLSRLFEIINGVLSLITGKSTMAVAKKGTDDYAKSLKKAGGAAKDLNHQLYGFDEITRQEDNSGGGGSSGIQYETKDIDGVLGNVKGVLEEIINAFKSGQFKKVGQLVASLLNQATKAITKWVKELRPKAKKWAKNIAEILVGMFDLENGLDTEAIGRMFGSVLNLINDTINTFLKTLLDNNTFFNIGVKLGEKIYGMFDEIEWDLVGQTLANGFNAVFTFLEGAVKNIPWEKIGQSFVQAITNFFATIDWQSAIIALTTGFNGVLTVIWEVMSGFNWVGLASQLLGYLNDAINHIDWATLSAIISKGINDLIAIFGTLVTSDTIVNLASKLGELVGGVLGNINFVQLGEDAKKGLGKIVTAFDEFLGKCNLEHIAEELAKGINAFFTPSEDFSFENVAKKASDGINKIISAVKTITNPITGINFSLIRVALASGISTLISETDFAGLVSSVSQGIINVSTEFWKLISNLFKPEDGSKSIGTVLSEMINSIFTDEKGNVKKDLFSDFGKSIGEGIKSILEDATRLFDGINTRSMATALAEWLKGVDWLGVLKDVFLVAKTFIKDALFAVGNIVGALVEWLGSLDWLEVAKTIVNGIFGVLESALFGIVGGLGTILHKLAVAVFGNDDETTQEIWKWTEEFEKDTDAAIKQTSARLALTYSDNVSSIASFVDKTKLANDMDEQAQFISNIFADSFGMIATDGMEAFEEKMRSYGIDESIISEITERYKTLCTKDEDTFIKALSDYGFTVSNAFADTLFNDVQASSESLAQALKLMSLGVDENTLAALDMSNLDENLSRFMVNSGKGINDVAKMLMSDNKEELANIARALGIEVGDDLGKVTPEALKKALLEGKKSVQEASDELAEIADQTNNKANMEINAKGASEGVINAIEGAQKEGEGKVSAAAQSTADAVKEKYEALPDDVKPYAESMMDYITTAMTDKNSTLLQPTIDSITTQIVEKVKNTLSSPVGAEIAQNFISGIWSIFNNNTSVSNSMQNVAKTTRDTAMAYLNATNGMTIGGNMIIGMINGMNAYGTMLVMTIAKICNVSVQTARDILGIKSPSKVFAEIGEYTMEGMQIGLENEGKNAVNTVANLAKEITSEGEGTTFGVMSNGLDTVADKLTRIADVFSDIADVITQMGGSLQIPTIAAGQTIPYRTQLGANGGSFSNGEALDVTAIENAFYSAITRAMSNSDNSQNINVYLDGRQIADSVTKYQRRQARAMGV